jgi:hypothetical protein
LLRGEQRPRLISFETEDFILPDSWRKIDPSLVERLATGFQAALPHGVTAELRNAIVEALRHLTLFVDMAEKDGLFLSEKDLQEERLQAELRRHLRSREVEVHEGEALGGGKTDLLLPGDIVVENKVRDRTADPLQTGPHYSWQARRYAQAVCRQVAISVVAYQPASEGARLPLNQRIIVRRLEGAPEDCAEVRLVIPWGEPVPSHAKAPAQ